MKVVFTIHAKEKLRRRKILKDEVEQAIKFPDKILKKQKIYYYQKKVERGTIEIPCERTESYIKIITVYWI